MNDYILSNNKEIAMIDVDKSNEHPFEYTGIILKNNFPDQLITLLNDFHKAIEEGTFSTVDEIETAIYNYNLRLKKAGIAIHHLVIKGNRISFYSKYPTGQGFVDERPR